jgi:LytS/YehU family sensor histidine kinase
MLNLRFEVTTPWWQTPWFYAFALSTVIALTWFFVSLRIRQIRKRQMERIRLIERMIESEHVALRAQLNPHFIFNCLSSIQQYIFTRDISSGNKYISSFSRLIRSTLQNSTKAFILLKDEVAYLSGYLALEKLLFEEKMDYHIEVTPELLEGPYLIPPMLIQPFVENSIRHGLRPKMEGKGHIHLSFRKAGDRLEIVVLDNGIGRAQAAKYKPHEHIEYQSKGMSLTADRIRTMNARYKEPVTIDIVDLQDEESKPAGTRVIMEFPFFHLLPEYETT